MKRTVILATLLIAGIALAVENPLLSAGAENADEWAEKLKEFEKPKFPKKVGYPQPFHSPNTYTYAMDDVCSACHTFAAHKKDEKYSPFYNAHGTFLSCNTCHFTVTGLGYAWVEIRNGKVVVETEGDFYGLRYIKSGEKVLLSGSESKAKITPIYKGVPVEIPLEGNEKLMKDAVAVAKMHNALTDEPLKCDDCHKEKGVLNFKALGFDAERVKDLEHNEILEGLKKYKTLHFPKFIW
jgi:cytochrome c553